MIYEQLKNLLWQDLMGHLHSQNAHFVSTLVSTSTKKVERTRFGTLHGTFFLRFDGNSPKYDTHRKAQFYFIFRNFELLAEK